VTSLEIRHVLFRIHSLSGYVNSIPLTWRMFSVGSEGVTEEAGEVKGGSKDFCSSLSLLCHGRGLLGVDRTLLWCLPGPGCWKEGRTGSLGVMG
jgi:hypothetical protein